MRKSVQTAASACLAALALGAWSCQPRASNLAKFTESCRPNAQSVTATLANDAYFEAAVYITSIRVELDNSHGERTGTVQHDYRHPPRLGVHKPRSFWIAAKQLGGIASCKVLRIGYTS